MLFIFSFNVNAFDGEKHIQPSNDAVALYNKCKGYYPNKFDLDLSEKDKETIARNSSKVDNISFSRAWNWHFYDKKFNYETRKPGNIDSGFLWMNRSLHKIFTKKSEKLLKHKKNKKRLLKYSGIVLHYIQDMAVPAHVAPIYHVSWKKDKFDSYTPRKLRQVNVTKSECKGYIDNKSSPISILETLANSTLDSIRTKINEQLYWTAFWNIYPEKPDNNKDGFSTYGKCGNIFGDTTNTDCKVDIAIYDKYFNSRYEEAVKASVELLVLVGRKSEE